MFSQEGKKGEREGKDRENEHERENEKDDKNFSWHRGGKAGDGCFDESTRIINAGIGIGGGNYYSGIIGSGYSTSTSPALSLSYEQAIKKKLGPGYIGVGGYLGFQSESITNTYFYDNNGYTGNFYYKDSWKYYMIAARGAYHWDVLNFKKGEIYGGLLVGLRFQSYSYTTNNPDPAAFNYSVSSGSVFPTFSLFVGGRWYFAKNIAVFGELGYGISYLTGGLSFRF